MFSSMISINSRMIIQYIAKENIVYCLRGFIAEEILKRHIKDCFKINSKQTIKMPKKRDYVKFKNFERKMKSPFIIYADFDTV